jgi:serine protease Do
MSPMHSTPLARPFALCLVLAVLLAGCSGGNREAGTTPGAATATATTAAASPASGAQPVVATGGAGAQASPAGARPAGGTAPAGSAPGTPAATAQGTLPDIAAVADRVRPATVLVLNFGGAGGGAFPGQPRGDVPQGSGTGFIYDPAGFIITNNHVVEGAQRLRVVLPPPDNRAFDARLVGRDPLTDLALLQIEGQGLPTVPLGDASQLQVGQWVVAIGNALSLPGGPTVTAGVVSALGRDVQEPGQQPGQVGPTLYDLIQTDAAINPGNSGGPLVNLRGEVVGINTLGSTEAQNINFAVSVETAKRIIGQLRQNGRVVRGYLGVGLQNVTPSVAAALGLSRQDGVVVLGVEPGSPAAAAGLQRGDVIVGIGDVAVRGQVDLQRALTERFRPGETVQLRIVRGGAEQAVPITLGDRAAQ